MTCSTLHILRKFIWIGNRIVNLPHGNSCTINFHWQLIRRVVQIKRTKLKDKMTRQINYFEYALNIPSWCTKPLGVILSSVVSGSMGTKQGIPQYSHE